MHITIAERQRPFSHTPGTRCLIPGTSLRATVYPTRVMLHDLSVYPYTMQGDYFLPLRGPVKDFTVQLDLEKGQIVAWGHYAEGYLRYRIGKGNSNKSYSLWLEKWPEAAGSSPEFFSASPELKEQPLSLERLSLGCHKAQDWDLVLRRNDSSEILPYWLRLGQLTSSMPTEEEAGTLATLFSCRSALQSKEKQAVLPAFQNLLHAGFEGILSPRLEDVDYQGYGLPPLPEGFHGSPLPLLTEGAKLIRDLFIRWEGLRLDILPLLPPAFHCGRLLQVKCGDVVEVDMEWSKKTIRRMVLSAKRDGSLVLGFQQGVKSFRLRTGPRERGSRLPASEPIAIESGKVYDLDNFMK